RLKTILRLFTIFVTLVTIGVGWAFWSLNQEMNEKIQQKQFLRPTEFYAYPLSFTRNHLWTAEEIESQLLRNNYRPRSTEQVLLPGDYLRMDRDLCILRLQRELPEEVESCISLVKRSEKSRGIYWIFLSPESIFDIWSSQGPVDEIKFEALLVAQYLGTEPLVQKNTELSDIPVHCLNAVLAIEDQNFLDHSGFTVNSFLRAVYKNIVRGQK